MLERRDGGVFGGIPVVASRQTKNADVVERIAAEDRCAVEATIFLAINLQVLLEALILLWIGKMNFFGVEVEDGIDFDEFDGVGVVHVESGGEVGGDVVVVGALHAEVGFVEHEEVEVLEFLELGFGGGDPRGAFVLIFVIDGRFTGRELVELCGVGESGADEVDVEAAFDVPHGDPKDGAEIGDVGAERSGGGILVEEGSVEERVEATGEVAGGFGGFGEGDEVVEGEEVGIFWRRFLWPGAGFQVGDDGFLGIDGEGKEEEERNDNPETQRELRGAEKRCGSFEHSANEIWCESVCPASNLILVFVLMRPRILRRQLFFGRVEGGFCW